MSKIEYAYGLCRRLTTVVGDQTGIRDGLKIYQSDENKIHEKFVTGPTLIAAYTMLTFAIAR